MKKRSCNRPKENTDMYVKSAKVLQAIYPSLVSKVLGKILGFIIIKDASELFRKSLNACTKLLIARSDFNASEFKKWAEIYYQYSMLIFGEQGLTPYKLKLLLMPQLVVSNFIGKFVRSSRIIQPPCEQGFPKWDNARRRKIA